MGATLSPSLSALLPAQNQMNAIIDDVVVEIERYAHLAPSLRLSADILREADNRRRLELTVPLIPVAHTLNHGGNLTIAHQMP
jgi:hypothetical protein